jgi:uncharacterized protein YecT (DUF1311 family)
MNLIRRKLNGTYGAAWKSFRTARKKKAASLGEADGSWVGTRNGDYALSTPHIDLNQTAVRLNG